MEYRRGTAMRKLSVRLSVCLSVSLSVRLSVKRVDCDKTEERSVQIFISYERSFSLVFGQLALVKAKSPIFNRCSPVAPQP